MAVRRMRLRQHVGAEDFQLRPGMVLPGVPIQHLDWFAEIRERIEIGWIERPIHVAPPLRIMPATAIDRQSHEEKAASTSSIV